MPHITNSAGMRHTEACTDMSVSAGAGIPLCASIELGGVHSLWVAQAGYHVACSRSNTWLCSCGSSWMFANLLKHTVMGMTGQYQVRTSTSVASA